MPLTRSRDKLIYKGSVDFTLVTLQQVVTFPGPMPDNNYDIYWSNPNIALNISITNKTINGFTIVIAVGMISTVKWAAVELVS